MSPTQSVTCLCAAAHLRCVLPSTYPFRLMGPPPSHLIPTQPPTPPPPTSWPTPQTLGHVEFTRRAGSRSALAYPPLLEKKNWIRLLKLCTHTLLYERKFSASLPSTVRSLMRGLRVHVSATGSANPCPCFTCGMKKKSPSFPFSPLLPRE
jgi:hypothetical protein